MRAGLRLGIILLAALLPVGSPRALAQSVPAATTNTPATDAVGPPALQNYSLKGTVTRSAEQPAAARGATQSPAPKRPAATVPAASPPARSSASSSQAETVPTRQPDRTQSDSVQPSRQSNHVLETIRQTAPAASVTVALPNLADGTTRGSAVVRPPAPLSAGEPNDSAGSQASEHKLLLWPWLLAALVLGAAGAFLFWRNRSREALAGGPRLDAFSAPEPEFATAPPPVRPAAPAKPPPSIPGIVTTRLRPWLEIAFHPIRFVVEDSRVAIEFELELFNSGAVAARSILLEATLLNAGAGQEQELTRFFANPIGQGERIAAIAPLKRMTMRTQVEIARDQVQVFEAAERKMCVPLIAINALYTWSSGAGQTSVSYLLGRDTKNEKLAPFRLDLGPRLFRGVGARLLPGGLRD